MRIEETVKEFGESVGVHNLNVNKYGVVHMEIENIGDLFIDECDKEDPSNHAVYVYLLRINDFPTEKLYKNMMSLCLNNVTRCEYEVNPVMRNDNVVGFIIRHEAEDFTMQSLSKSIEILQEMQDRLQNM